MNDDLVRSAMTLDDRLDDIKRAQIWTRIDREIDARPARAFPWQRLLATVACAAAAVAGWVVLRRAPDPTVLVAPADSTLTAHVGPHTRAELIGPARLELEGTPGDATRVRLREGTLVAEFTGGPGRSLHIEAPGAAIDIVGTLFAVEVAHDQTCVSVSHGKVAVTAGNTKLAVGTGESWCSARPSTEPRIEPLSPATRTRFDQFAAVAAVAVASAEPAVPVSQPAESQPAESQPAEPAPVQAPHVEAAHVEGRRADTSKPRTSKRSHRSRVTSKPLTSKPLTSKRRTS